MENKEEDELDQLISCPVCLENYDRAVHVPKLLNRCGHSICEDCIRRISHGNGNNRLECPTCRESVTLDPANPLHSNFDLLSMIDVMKRQLTLKSNTINPTVSSDDRQSPRPSINEQLVNERRRFADEWLEREQLRKDSLASSELSARLIVSRLANVISIYRKIDQLIEMVQTEASTAPSLDALRQAVKKRDTLLRFEDATWTEVQNVQKKLLDITQTTEDSLNRSLEALRSRLENSSPLPPPPPPLPRPASPIPSVPTQPPPVIPPRRPSTSTSFPPLPGTQHYPRPAPPIQPFFAPPYTAPSQPSSSTSPGIARPQPSSSTSPANARVTSPAIARDEFVCSRCNFLISQKWSSYTMNEIIDHCLSKHNGICVLNDRGNICPFHSKEGWEIADHLRSQHSVK